MASVAAATQPQIVSGKKAKVEGTTVSRNGDLIQVKEKKSGTVVVVDLVDGTKIERKSGYVQWFRHNDMDVTAMMPGLTIEPKASAMQMDSCKPARLRLHRMSLPLKWRKSSKS
jgi:hypothetical protein